jgi:hypothetical protein
MSGAILNHSVHFSRYGLLVVRLPTERTVRGLSVSTSETTGGY